MEYVECRVCGQTEFVELWPVDGPAKYWCVECGEVYTISPLVDKVSYEVISVAVVQLVKGADPVA